MVVRATWDSGHVTEAGERVMYVGAELAAAGSRTGCSVRLIGRRGFIIPAWGNTFSCFTSPGCRATGILLSCALLTANTGAVPPCCTSKAVFCAAWGDMTTGFDGPTAGAHEVICKNVTKN